MRTHELKTWSHFFQEVLDGRKLFEIRRNDRDFKLGDHLHLIEVEAEDLTAKKTGRELVVEVLYMTDFAQQGDYVVMSIKPI